MRTPSACASSRARCSRALSCTPGRGDSGLVARIAGSALGADTHIGNMATEEFLSCLSKAGIEKVGSSLRVLPRPRVKDTRAEVIKQAAGATYVHPAALFALTDAEIALHAEGPRQYSWENAEQDDGDEDLAEGATAAEDDSSPTSRRTRFGTIVWTKTGQARTQTSTSLGTRTPGPQRTANVGDDKANPRRPDPGVHDPLKPVRAPIIRRSRSPGVPASFCQPHPVRSGRQPGRERQTARRPDTDRRRRVSTRIDLELSAGQRGAFARLVVSRRRRAMDQADRASGRSRQWTDRPDPRLRARREPPKSARPRSRAMEQERLAEVPLRRRARAEAQRVRAIAREIDPDMPK